MPELDFVLEMGAIDDPERWKFFRSGDDKGTRADAMAGWRDRLAGGALTAFMVRTGIFAASAALAKARTRRGNGIVPGLTRGGRRIDDAGNPNRG